MSSFASDPFSPPEWPLAGGFAVGSDGGAPDGGAFLPDLFGGLGRQRVQFAFGADPTGEPDAWGWVDVTTRFEWDPGVMITIGDRDEASSIVPASFTGTMKNWDDAFTIDNALSPYWPNVVENLPVRALLDVGTGPALRFQGYVTSLKPIWNADRSQNEIAFQAHGVARRLKQGEPPAMSALRRFAEKTTSLDEDGAVVMHDAPIHLWTLEDRSGSLSASNSVQSIYALRTVLADQLPSFGGRTIAAGSAGAPVFNIVERLFGDHPPVPLAASQDAALGTDPALQFSFLLHVREMPAADKDLLEVRCVGSIAYYRVTLDVSVPGLVLTAYSAAGTNLGSTSAPTAIDMEDRAVWVAVTLIQGAVNATPRLNYSTWTIDPLTGVGTADESVQTTATLAGLRNNSVTGVRLGVLQDLEDIAIGMFGIYAGGFGTFPDTSPAAVQAYAGENVLNRMRRICLEEGLRIEIVGDSQDMMGPQPIGTALSILSECALADGGLLVDGLSSGLTYYTRSSAYSVVPGLVFDATLAQIGELDPDHDDQGRVNSFTAQNPRGLGQTVVRTDGALGTDTVGVYDDSATPNLNTDAGLVDYAAWRVHRGTVPGYRWPRLTFELAKPLTSPLAQPWLDRRPFDRLDVVGMTVPGTPTLRLLLRGWTERWNSRVWSVTANAGPYGVNDVIVLAGATGADDYTVSLDTSGTVLSGAVAAAASSFTVVTTTGPLWSADAADASAGDPMYVIISGIKITVTDVAAAIGQAQVFTVDPVSVTKPLADGAAVTVWQPPILGR